MKAEFEFTMNLDGKPVIKFRHHDKMSSLEQRALGIFIRMANEKGIRLVQTSGFLSDGESFDNYEIVPL